MSTELILGVTAGIGLTVLLLAVGYLAGRRSRQTATPNDADPIHQESINHHQPSDEGQDEHQPLIDIFEFDARDYEPTESGESFRLKGRVSEGLLHAIPEGIHLAQGQTYRLVFNPDVARGLRNGADAIVKSRDVPGAVRAFTRDGKQISGQGNLLKAGKAAKMAAASFQMVSFVVGQAHLQGIQQKLASIEGKLSDLISSVVEGHHGKIQGNIDYMKEVAQSIISGELAPENVSAYLTQLESIEREFLQLGQTLDAEASRLIHKIAQMDLDAAMDTIEDDQVKLIDCVDDYKILIRRAEGVLIGRACCVQLSQALPCPPEVLETRRESISGQHQQWSKKFNKIHKDITKRTKELRGKFTFAETEEKLRSAVKSKSSKVLMEYERSATSTMDGIEQLREAEAMLMSGFETGESEFLLKIGSDTEEPELLYVRRGR